MKLAAHYIQGACYIFKWNFLSSVCYLNTHTHTHTINIKNYNSVYCFIWMCNLVSHVKGRMQAICV